MFHLFAPVEHFFPDGCGLAKASLWSKIRATNLRVPFLKNKKETSILLVRSPPPLLYPAHAIKDINGSKGPPQHFEQLCHGG